MPYFMVSQFMVNLITFILLSLLQIERPLQKHGGRLEHNEKYCGSCFGAEEVFSLKFT